MGAPTAGSATLTEADSARVDRIVPSPNFGDRRGRGIDALILHYTGMASGEAALTRLCDSMSEVSCHYLVWEDGKVDQLVAEAARAWHAGRSFWAGEADLNAVSIGIEVVNGGHDFGCPPFPPAQVDAVIALCQDVCARRAISTWRVLAHSDVAPDRKLDPGEHFPWRTLAARGVGAWVDAGREEGVVSDRLSIEAMQGRLARLGYGCPVTGMLDEPTACVIRAFQRHWRPSTVDGVPDGETLATLARLSGRCRPAFDRLVAGPGPGAG